jgi:EmrB/QacA subfamily drug resistance transporter
MAIGRSKRSALILLCSASFIAVMDTTIVSIALPSMRQAVGLSAAGSQWVLNAYALVFGGLLLLFGRVADLYGRVRLFAVGLAVFIVGLVIAGLASAPLILIVGRGVQGLGAAAFVPASLSLLTVTFSEEDERNRAVGFYGAMAALGFVVGMVGGGVITELWGWRWVFLINVPIAMATLLPSRRLLHDRRNTSAARQLDVLGAVSVTAGLILLIYAMTSVPGEGWSVPTLVTGVLGCALLAGFVAVEKRHPAPLVPLDLVTTRPVLIPNAAIALQSMIGIAWLYVLTLYFQEVIGTGPLKAGMLFVPMTLASLIAAPIAGRLGSRIGIRATAITGLTLLGCGIAAMMAGMSAGGSIALLLAGSAVGEAGFMLSNVSLVVAGTSGLDDDKSGLAAGLLKHLDAAGEWMGARCRGPRSGGEPA